MAKLVWDADGQRLYETGTRMGVLYRRDPKTSNYDRGYAWNGLTGVTESPSGAEPTALWADDSKYLNLVSAEEFGGTIEAYTYPAEFSECNGEAAVAKGVYVGQQTREPFGMCYRTVLGNDVLLENYAYKLHLVYGATVTPSERAYATINDSPEAITFSWEFSTTPVNVSVDGKTLKPTATLVIESNNCGEHLSVLEGVLYGDETYEPYLPTPDEVLAILKDGETTALDEKRKKTAELGG